MKNVYEACPVFENEKFCLRQTVKEDYQDLLKVYSDMKAVPFFNSDNCYGDNFHYTSEERMKEAIDFWLSSYENKFFVRWSIIDKKINKAVGTIELFHRTADDYYNDCGLLRMDLRSDYEKSDEIMSILSLILIPTYTLFDCNHIATKAIKDAAERRTALKKLGFAERSEKLIGHDGTEYDSYFEQKMETPQLETERLILRKVEKEDTDIIFNCWMQDEDVSRYMCWKASDDINEAKEFVEFELGNIEDSQWNRWIIVEKQTITVIGTCLIFFNEDENSWDISYNLGKQYWGKGYITEAMKEVMQYAVNILGIKECIAVHAVENPASGKVIEKLGFQYEKDVPYECNGGTIVTTGKYYKYKI